jgi:hypothetical protein
MSAMSPAQFAKTLHDLAAQLGEPDFAALGDDEYAETIAHLDLKNGAAVMEAECATIIIPGSNRADTRKRAECLAQILELCFNAQKHVNDAIMHPEDPGFVLDAKRAVHVKADFPEAQR